MSTEKKINVVTVINGSRVVLNVGKADGITIGDRFLLYSLGEELFDTDTGESLGILEIPKGEGVIDHVQEKMSQLSSTRTKKITKERHSPGVVGMMGGFGKMTETELQDLPFDYPEQSDLARKI
eukprot:TRINITY_DN5271_c0_g1_i1.p2 TRINITY_DN5271_c0_g1~~TRINITY_DN5271_c0_g1_i1.p2  ORF type:complete len:124 (+),score=12.68 TRINITY_DN5271_c0_g1_i1:588-959(+)